jgi:hypothetical protein
MENIIPTNYKRLSGSTLKIIAMICMFIDHIAIVLVNNNFFMRSIGRIAFPIFCFLLVQGFIYTSNVKKYALRLGGFALLSEIPFDLALSNKMFDFSSQNVYFTLLIGLLILVGIEHFKDDQTNRNLSILGGCLAAVILRVDYSLPGILLIVFLYQFRFQWIGRQIIIVIFNLVLRQPIGILSAFILQLYNGERGYQLKYVFYAFYPLHLLILYGIKQIM